MVNGVQGMENLASTTTANIGANKSTVATVATDVESGQSRAKKLAEINTRFGSVQVNLDRTIEMPVGMLGFGEFHRYTLVQMPNVSLSAFKLLQCIGNDDLSFVVLPINKDGSFITQTDSDAAIATLGIEPEAAVVTLVVSPRNENGSISFTVNCRAPVIIDSKRLQAWQYVLGNAQYQVRQPIELG